jgi:two-component system cell cycle sensor histidine kinase/response regulator CckA
MGMDRQTQTDNIAIDQVKRLAAQSILGIIATVVNAVILASILAIVVPISRIVIWFGSVLAVSLGRIIVHRQLQKSKLTADNLQQKKRILLIGLAGMIAGSVGVFASLRSAFYCYSLPTMLPLAIRLVMVGGGMHYGMAAMAVIFWLMMDVTAKRLNREIRAFINIKYQNVDLINELENEIAERRAAEEKLLAKNQQIETIVAERTAELQSVNKKLIEEIDDRIEAEKALRESKKKFMELANFLPQVIFETDISGNITFANRNAAHAFAIANADVAKTFSCFDMIAPQDRRRARDNFLAILKGDPRDSVEYSAIRQDGTPFPIIIHSTVVLRDSQPAGVRGIIIDLTEVKKAEEEQKQLEAKLQRAQKMEILGTVAGGVAHDLNNILSGLVSYPDLLLAQLPKDSPLYSPIQIMRKSGKKAAAIVEDLLTLTRRGVVSEEVLNLNDVVSEYLQSPEYEKMLTFHRDTHVLTQLAPDLLSVRGSHVHLSKTVMNLVSNAAEAMLTGGDVVITTFNQYIDQPIKGYDDIEEGDYIVLTVADEGIGISPEDEERIFEPFFTKKVMGRSGTGLGMAVVWGTVKDHKGYIDVQSVLGKGTTFSLYFPVTREKGLAMVTDDQNSVRLGKGEVILVVDDVEEQRIIASEMLAGLGYRVEAVASGEKALEWLSEKKADLILLDMVMDPGMDGLDTYRAIIKVRDRQKAVIASGYSETDRVKEALRLGAGPCLKKPYTLSQLGQTVYAILNHESA